MPEVVNVYRDTGSWIEVARVKEAILETYHADFGKYQTRIKSDVIQEVFRKLPLLISQKTMYSHLASDERTEINKKALHALELARVVTRCFHSAGNGIPLAAEQKSNHFKTFFLDIGLVLTALGITIDAISTKLNDTTRGVIAEQFIAQHLLDDRELFQKPQLYYWNRQKRGTTSEVDFLTVYMGKVIPIEIKSGAAGSMKSLQVFMALKKDKPDFAIRFLDNLPERQTVAITGSIEHYDLVSLPHYLVEHWRRFA
jgi:hypothetical protein